jgi:hypothetical protein
MSYFLIPKTHDYKIQNPDNLQDKLTCQSLSLNFQFLFLNNQLLELIKNQSIINNTKESIIDNYYYLYNSFDNECVSKLIYKSNIFYEFIELISFINLNIFFHPDTISVYINEDDDENIMNSIKYHRYQINVDEKDKYFIKNNINEQYNLIIFNHTYEFNSDLNLFLYTSIKTVLNNLIDNGIFILKVPNLDDLIINQIVYLLSYLFDKIHIIKPSISSSFTKNKYILCKGFCNNTEIKNLFRDNNNINTMLNTQLPIYFINKFKDINIIIGQKNLDNICGLVNLLINKFDADKLSIYYKNNLVKCVNWCDKYKIPCNKFTNQINIFLSKNCKTNDDMVSESL